MADTGLKQDVDVAMEMHFLYSTGDSELSDMWEGF